MGLKGGLLVGGILVEGFLIGTARLRFSTCFTPHRSVVDCQNWMRRNPGCRVYARSGFPAFTPKPHDVTQPTCRSPVLHHSRAGGQQRKRLPRSHRKDGVGDRHAVARLSALSCPSRDVEPDRDSGPGRLRIHKGPPRNHREAEARLSVLRHGRPRPHLPPRPPCGLQGDAGRDAGGSRAADSPRPPTLRHDGDPLPGAVRLRGRRHPRHAHRRRHRARWERDTRHLRQGRPATPLRPGEAPQPAHELPAGAGGAPRRLGGAPRSGRRLAVPRRRHGRQRSGSPLDRAEVGHRAPPAVRRSRFDPRPHRRGEGGEEAGKPPSPRRHRPRRPRAGAVGFERPDRHPLGRRTAPSPRCRSPVGLPRGARIPEPRQDRPPGIRAGAAESSPGQEDVCQAGQARRSSGAAASRG